MNPDNLPCPHARPDWHMCPHCQGINEHVSDERMLMDPTGIPLQVNYTVLIDTTHGPARASVTKETFEAITETLELAEKFKADNERLRELIRLAEIPDYPYRCPWCRYDTAGFKHLDDCPAFTVEGKVK